MGSHDFANYQAATDAITTAAEAYDYLCSEATDEYGNNGYNGTISTTTGFVMHTRQVMSRVAARSAWESAMDTYQYSKWGPAGCIAIGAQEVTLDTITKKIKLTDESMVYTSRAHELLGLVPSVEVRKFEVLSDDRKYRVKVQRAKGTTTRSFFGNHRGALNKAGSLADAIAAATANLEAGTMSGEITITEEVLRGGSPPAVVRKELVSRTVTVKANIATPKGSVGGVVGWYFFGMAAS